MGGGRKRLLLGWTLPGGIVIECPCYTARSMGTERTTVNGGLDIQMAATVARSRVVPLVAGSSTH